MAYKLSLSFPHLSDRSVEVTQDRPVIAGRSETCTLDLSQYFPESAQVVSREHFKIYYEDGSFLLVDLESVNGTWLNHYRLNPGTPHRLAHGDRIRLANYRHLNINVLLERDRLETAPIPIPPTLAPILGELRESRDVLLLGVAGTGKTTLLRNLAETSQSTERSPNAQSMPLCLYVNCMSIDDISLVSLFRVLIAATKPVFDEWPADIRRQYEMLETPDCPSDKLTSAVVATIHRVQQHYHRPVVLLLDQFDDVYRELPAHLFFVLKELKLQSRTCTQYVIAMRREFQGDSAPLLQFLRALPGRHDHWMPPAEATELERIVESHHLNEWQARMSIRYGAGQPHLTDLVARAISGLPETEETSLIEQLLLDQPISIHCDQIWLGLLPQEQQVLLEIAGGKRVSASRHLDTLTKYMWILRDARPALEFASPLFGAYVAAQAHQVRGPGLLFDERTSEFVLDDKHIPRETFTKLEYDLLYYLYKNAGQVCPVVDISEKVWPYDPETSQLAVHPNSIARVVHEIRAKLDERSAGAGKRHVRTVRGQGYKLIIN